jgi:alpha-tubulin suppressor-like RCC1 family protein
MKGRQATIWIVLGGIFLAPIGCTLNRGKKQAQTASPVVPFAESTGRKAAVSTGDGFTCALKTDGTLWCWGYNDNGELGDGTVGHRYHPIQVPGLGNSVTALSSGAGHSCALKNDSSLWCWGYNNQGQLGDGSAVNKLQPVQVQALGTSVASFSTGGEHTCALRKDGTFWCWGGNSYGQLGDGTAANKLQPVQVQTLGTSVISFSASAGHTCVLKRDGSLWCWGNNSQGQLGDGTIVDRRTPVQVQALGTSVASMSAGKGHTCALKKDGTLWCWGNNSQGQLGDGTAENKLHPVQVQALGTSVDSFSIGGEHTCALRKDGTLWCWGANSYGQLGDGTTLQRAVPVQIRGLAGFVSSVSASLSHTCALRTDGSLWCWGANTAGQLGHGSPEDGHEPLRVMGIGSHPK